MLIETKGYEMKTLTLTALFFQAIAHVETGHLPEGERDIAIGDGGRSLGRYQISEAYWNDALDYYGFEPDELPYREYVIYASVCREMIRGYMKRYKAKSLKQAAKMHNGGPRGHKKKATRIYWKKVKAYMDE